MVLDLVRLTASELQALLTRGELSSVQLIKQCLAQIERHNRQGLKLNAIISVAPEELLLSTAVRLDEERAQGKCRGPFHGLPILVKDGTITHSDLGMPTTAGSLALMSAKSNRNARVVDKLLDKGLMVIGKTNLNEWSSQKAMGSTNGWSAVGGQTRPAYTDTPVDQKDGVMSHTNPCGSSSGSAVGVSAGSSPLSIGTEVEGSLIQPAARAALYCVKPTIGITDLDGVFAVSDDFDTLGAMAKSALDVAVLTEYLLTDVARSRLPPGGYAACMRHDFAGLSIGFVDPAEWFWPEAAQRQHGTSREELTAGYMRAIDRITNSGARAIFPISLPPVSEFMIDGQAASNIAISAVIRQKFEAFLGAFTESEVRTVADVVRFNEDHADKELPKEFPEQGKLLNMLKEATDEKKAEEALAHCRRIARDEGIDKALRDHKLDLVALPMDSPCARLAASAGYPIAAVPLGTLSYNGRPFGMAVIGKANREDLLFKFMSAFEASSEPRPVPRALVA